MGAQASMLPPASRTACRGIQPVSAVAEPLSSRAERKAWLRKGWSGPTQASHAAGSSWAMPWTSLRLSSVLGVQSGKLKDRFDLDGSIERQARATDGKPRMAPRLCHGAHHKVGGAVDDLGLIRELGRAADEAAELQAAREAGEVAFAGGPRLRQQVERAQARRGLALLDADVTAELTDHGHAPALQRQLPRDEEQPAADGVRDVVGGGGRRVGEAEAGPPQAVLRCG